MNLPKDPLLMMSVGNTKLRDCYADFGTLRDGLNEGCAALETKRTAIGYRYDKQRNQFGKG